MDLREAVDKLEWLRLQERDWRIRVRGSGYEQLRADIRRATAVREAYLQMAEAAIALAEFTSHWWFLHKPLPNWDERFDELVKAFEKAKEACNSPAGEGET